MNDKILRSTGLVFLVALLVHGADHLRRGVDAVTTHVFWSGNAQFVMAAIALVLVFRHHRLAPAFAIGVGFASALGFVAAHLLPHWSAFSDAFTGSQRGPDVTGFSWFAALFEIAADLAFGCAGVVVARRRRDEAGPPSGRSGQRSMDDRAADQRGVDDRFLTPQ